MFLTEELFQTLQLLLPDNEGTTGSVRVIRPVSGGCINSCYQLKAGGKFFFLKVNRSDKFPGMFPAEAEGLKRIRETRTVCVPDVICHGFAGRDQFLVMNWFDAGGNSLEAQGELGIQLAALHTNSATEFGLDHNNYMGSLVQKNNGHLNWTDFYIAERLVPQLEISIQKGLADSRLVKDFERLFKHLDNLYPKEKAALVHGDLWNGNYLVTLEGTPVLIDPAIAYCHREVDIAMTTLFGGFDDIFYISYNEAYPLEGGWEQRLDLWNLYPLLIHLNLFGKSYLYRLKTCIQKYL